MVDVQRDGGQLVGRWDAGARLFVATGWTYGPAGPATVELAPGLRFSVDFADPDVTTEITIEAPFAGDATPLDPRVERAARLLLDPTTVRRLLALADSAGGDRMVTITEASRREELPAGTRRGALGRFALLAEMVADARVQPLGAAIAGLEAAGIATDVDPGMSVMLGPARALAREAAETLLLLASTRDLALPDGGVRVIRAAVPVLGDELLARRLTALARDLDGPYSEVQSMRSPPARTTAQLDMDERYATVAARPPENTVEVDGAGASAVLVDGTEIQVRTHYTADDDRWARVFRRRDRLLLALAPLRTNAFGDDALLVIPPGLHPDELVVDLTDTPEAPRPSDVLAAVRAAVEVGREACRLERLGESDAAAARWSECADRWAAVGDDRRSALARRYASGERAARTRRPERVRGLTGQPFVADRLV